MQRNARATDKLGSNAQGTSSKKRISKKSQFYYQAEESRSHVEYEASEISNSQSSGKGASKQTSEERTLSIKDNPMDRGNAYKIVKISPKKQ